MDKNQRLTGIERDFQGAIQVAADALLAEGISVAETVEWLSAAVAESDHLGELSIAAWEDAPDAETPEPPYHRAHWNVVYATD